MDRYEEALERAKAGKPIDEVFPELKESEDERIRKALIQFLTDIKGISESGRTTWAVRREDAEMCNGFLAYLEKQKEQLKKGLGKYLEEENLAYRLNWVMQDYYKAGEDDEEREHRFKCYKLFWDALEDENFFEPKKQNNGAEEYTDFTIYHPLKNGKGEYECIPYSFYGSLTSFSEDKDLIDFLRTCFYTEEECNEWIEQQKEQKPDDQYVHGYYEGFSDSAKAYRPAEWSEEDEEMVSIIITALGTSRTVSHDSYLRVMDWLKSLRPQQKQDEEPTEIRFAGKIYKVHGFRAFPGGTTGYIIEDEPGHYDCIINPEEVLGDGGYGVKSSGSPYPTKDATFAQPHWKPSEGQMAMLRAVLNDPKNAMAESANIALESLYNDLKNLM